MTQEQMENAMNFIVEQQAKFSVDMDLLKERHEQRMKEIMADQSRLQELMKKLDEAKVKAFKALSKLQKAQKRPAQNNDGLRLKFGFSSSGSDLFIACRATSSQAPVGAAYA